MASEAEVVPEEAVDVVDQDQDLNTKDLQEKGVKEEALEVVEAQEVETVGEAEEDLQSLMIEIIMREKERADQEEEVETDQEVQEDHKNTNEHSEKQRMII